MKRIHTIICLIFIFCLNIEAQSNKYFFNLNVPSDLSTISNSLYQKIEFIDSRDNYEFNDLRIDNSAFTNQLNVILGQMIDRTAQNYTLVLQLRNLCIYNDPTKGDYVLLRVSLYERNQDDYYCIKTLRSDIPLKDNNEFQKTVSNIIAQYISQNLNSLEINDQTEILSFEEVKDIDNLEKDKIKSYNVYEFKDGIYTTFRDFADQVPNDTKITPKLGKKGLENVKVTTPDNKQKKISPDKIFAVVVEGQPYISANKKYIPLYIEDRNFYFEDDVVSKDGVVITPSFSAGIGSGGYRAGGIGINIFNKSQKKHIRYKIDHLSGNFIIQPND